MHLFTIFKVHGRLRVCDGVETETNRIYDGVEAGTRKS